MTTLLLSLLFAQPPTDPGTPGPMHKLLDRMAGGWTVDVTYKIGDGPEMKSKATCKAAWIMDGRFIRKTYTSEMMGQPFIVEQTIGYDNLRKEFFEWQIESNNTGRIETRGTVGPADSIICTGPSMDMMTMKKATLKTITTFQGANRYTIEWWMKTGDSAEVKQVTLVHNRIILK